MGFRLDEINAIDPQTLAPKLAHARQALPKSGAHFVGGSIADVGLVIEAINFQLARGERP